MMLWTAMTSGRPTSTPISPRIGSSTSPNASKLAGGLPLDRAAVAEEAARRFSRRAFEHRAPDDRGGALFDAARGAAAAHVGAHPTGAHGVHADAARREGRSQKAHERVEADLRDAVGRRGPARLAVAAGL